MNKHILVLCVIAFLTLQTCAIVGGENLKSMDMLEQLSRYRPHVLPNMDEKEVKIYHAYLEILQNSQKKESREKELEWGKIVEHYRREFKKQTGEAS